MITVFNRREAAITHSMEEQARIREVLSGNGIVYTYKVIDRTNPTAVMSGRAKTGTCGINMDYAKGYTFYVHKKDFEAVKALLERNRTR